ncbi:MAG: hypothetical protein HZA22_03230 [Nitrospirae bacterium]|nr:hypothetical protein [Nitrospirota bacterium]
MKRMIRTLVLAGVLALAMSGVAGATPSTQIWIPSTDVQAFKTFHLGFDNYVRVAKDPAGNYWPTIYDAGVTAGVLPFEKVQMEVGVDYIRYGSNSYDNHPIYFNAKLGTPEGSIFDGSPALAAGIYNVGTNGGDITENTQQDIGYVLAAKTIPVVGRLSAGWYFANGDNVNFKDHLGETDNDGVLLSWDRVMTEIDDRLWLAVDYMGGDNAYGAVNVGAAWAFSKNVSVIVGYDVYTRKATGGEPTFTTQIDINF